MSRSCIIYPSGAQRRIHSAATTNIPRRRESISQRERERKRERHTVASLKPRHKKQADREFAFEESSPSFRHDATSPDLTSISMTMKYRNVPAAGISMKYLWRYSLVTGRMKMSEQAGYPAFDAT